MNPRHLLIAAAVAAICLGLGFGLTLYGTVSTAMALVAEFPAARPLALLLWLLAALSGLLGGLLA